MWILHDLEICRKVFGGHEIQVFIGSWATSAKVYFFSLPIYKVIEKNQTNEMQARYSSIYKETEVCQVPVSL